LNHEVVFGVIILLYSIGVSNADGPLASSNVANKCSVIDVDTGYVYYFEQWSIGPAYIVLDNRQNQDTWSFYLQFCDRIDGLYGNASKFEKSQWLGWNFGIMQSFTYIDEKTFQQVYTNGDSGYPCTTGRNTTVTIGCDNCPSGGACYNGNASYCLCEAAYDRESNPCLAELWVSLDCPSPQKPPIIVRPKERLTVGAIVGIIFLLLVILVVVGFAGGYMYNNKVLDKTGWNAVPGYEYFALKTGIARYSQGTYSRTLEESGYGTL